MDRSVAWPEEFKRNCFLSKWNENVLFLKKIIVSGENCLVISKFSFHLNLSLTWVELTVLRILTASPADWYSERNILRVSNIAALINAIIIYWVILWWISSLAKEHFFLCHMILWESEYWNPEVEAIGILLVISEESLNGRRQSVWEGVWALIVVRAICRWMRAHGPVQPLQPRDSDESFSPSEPQRKMLIIPTPQCGYGFEMGMNA